MGAYNFKPQFEADIMADRKRHTIRAKRKHPDKPGSTCHLYVGLRHKGARLLKRRRCVKVQDIQIFWVPSDLGGHPAVWIDGESLTRSECDALAKSDGFSSFRKMIAFWDGRLPFSGDLIHWESDEQAARNPTSAIRKHRPETERSANKKKKVK